MTTRIEPGWYPDGHGAIRWWDGQGWTAHVREPAPVAAPPPTSPLAVPPAGAGLARRSRAWLWITLGAVAAVILAGLAVALVGLVILPATIGDRAASDGGLGTVETPDPAASAVTAAYTAYLDAWFTGDCQAEAELATESYRGGSVEEYCAGAGEPFAPEEIPSWSVAITALDVAGGTATLTADETATWPDGTVETETWTYGLVLEDGRWLVDAAW